MWSLAEERSNGHSSGGTAIFAKAHIGLSTLLDQPSGELVEARLVGGHIWSWARGGLAVLGAYMFTGEGLSARYCELLSRIEVWISLCSGPWIIAADWNVTPEQLTQWANSIGGIVVAPDGFTCFQATPSKIDFFIVKASMAHVIRKAETLSGFSTAPHVPLALWLKGIPAPSPPVLLSWCTVCL